MDYKYFLSLFIVEPILATIVVSLSAVPLASYINQALSRTLGPRSNPWEPTWLTRVMYTLILVMAIDLGYFIFHYLAHKSAILWEFHKVHHAAEVLTPVTNYRNHPVDLLVQQVFIGITVALLNGALAYLYRRPVGIIMVLDTSIVLLLYNLTAQFRHTHVWFSYGPIISRVLCSPAQHQIHHSRESRHLDTNFGRVFTLWDWMTGSLYVPKEREEFSLGLREADGPEYLTLWGCYVSPFVKAGRVMVGACVRRASIPPSTAPDIGQDRVRSV
jgi:sterol desaturase/sphingolipid hydroxylase (fatty acid hydroxylase superfamily)